MFNKWQWQLPEPLKRLGERERDNLRADWQRIAPHDPKVRKRWVWAGVAVIAVLALLPAPHKADSSRPKEAEAPRSTTTSSWSPPSPYKVANGKLLACHDQAMYERFRNIAHDSEAYTRLGVVALLAGQCRLFQHGTRVRVEDRSGFLTRLACIAEVGDPRPCYWTNSDWLDDPPPAPREAG